MKKSPESVAEIEIKEGINCMGDLLSHSKVEVGDVRLLINKACKVLEKCRELRKARDNHIQRKEDIIELLEKEKKTSQILRERLRECCEKRGEI